MISKNTLNQIVLAASCLAAAGASAQTVAGVGSTATSGVAIGTNANQVDVTTSFSDGGPTVTYGGGIAIGNGTLAMGKNVVIGDGLKVPQDDIRGSYTFTIGGLNTNNNQVELRRVVGMADGMFDTDGATLGQSTRLANEARLAAQAYAFDLNTATSVRVDAAEARLTAHDGVLVDHEDRISALEGRLGEMDERYDELRKDINAVRREALQGVAAVSAMSVEVPQLAPNEQAMVAGVGTYGGYGALAIGYVRSNSVGQLFSVKAGFSGSRAAVSAGGAWKF